MRFGSVSNLPKRNGRVECGLLIICLGAINVIWPHFFGGCNITRPTDEWLLTAGEWEKVDLRPGIGENKYDTIPHVTGTLTKRM